MAVRNSRVLPNETSPLPSTPATMLREPLNLAF